MSTAGTDLAAEAALRAECSLDVPWGVVERFSTLLRSSGNDQERAAIDYLTEVGLPAIEAYEHDLLAYATAALREVPGLRLIGTARAKASVLSFLLGQVHPHDAGTVLDREGIAVRTGHLCAQPLMRRFGVTALVRASLALYNRREDVDALVAGLHKVRELFG